MNSSPRGRGSDKVRSAPHLSHLSLPELRTYRRHLTEEDERVAYWRRLVESRSTALSHSAPLPELDTDDLMRALGTTGSGDRRALLLAATDQDPLPLLPEIDGVWAAAVGADPQDRESVRAALEAASARLGDYRLIVQERLATATGELITRYIENPEAAFDLTTEPSGSSS